MSYFWQIHDRRVWPVYYTNTVNTLSDLNLWQPTEDLAEAYIQFKLIHEELRRLFTEESDGLFGLYDVEHVFWFKGGNPFAAGKVLKKEPKGDSTDTVVTVEDQQGSSRLPESFVPPIVAIFPRNKPDLIEAAKASGTSLERAF